MVRIQKQQQQLKKKSQFSSVAQSCPIGFKKKQLKKKPKISSVQIISVAQSCPTLSDPMNCSRPGRPVHHQLLEFTQIHVHPRNDLPNIGVLCT